MVAIRDRLDEFKELNAVVVAVSSDTEIGVSAMKMIEKINFSLVSSKDILEKLGLGNSNMSRAPVTLVLGKNMAKYWVYEGVNASDRPSIDDMLEQIIRVSKIYH